MVSYLQTLHSCTVICVAICPKSHIFQHAEMFYKVSKPLLGLWLSHKDPVINRALKHHVCICQGPIHRAFLLCHIKLELSLTEPSLLLYNICLISSFHQDQCFSLWGMNKNVVSWDGLEKFGNIAARNIMVQGWRSKQLHKRSQII